MMRYALPTKNAICEVCGGESPICKDGVCMKTEALIADTLWDYMNCSYCGCQIILGRRYRDINDPYYHIDAAMEEPIGKDGDGDV